MAGAFEALREGASNLAAQLDCRIKPSTNLFIVRKVGDEASLALGTGQFISWATTKAFARLYAQVSELDQQSLRWLSYTGRPLPKSVRALWLITLIWFIAPIVWSIIVFSSEGVTPGDPPALRFTVALAAVAITATVLVKTRLFERPLFGAALLALAGAASLTSFAFGTKPPRSALEGSNIRWGRFRLWLGGMILALSIEIHTEASPAGLWPIRLFEPTPDDRRADTKTLVHSAYDDPAVITDLIRWIDASTGLRGIDASLGR
jgi:hypothetical protein